MTNTLYTATDKNGTVRISAGRDVALASAKWRSTRQVCIYRSAWGGHWYGSCRMNHSALSRFKNMGLKRVFHGHSHSFDRAAAIFAAAVSEAQGTAPTYAVAPDDDDVQVGYSVDNYAVVKYRGYFAARAYAEYSTAVKRRSPTGDHIIVWNDNSGFRMFALNSKESRKLVPAMIKKINEVADELQKV